LQYILPDELIRFCFLLEESMLKMVKSLLLVAGIVASVNASAVMAVQVNNVDLGVAPSGVTSFYESVWSGRFADTINFTIGSQSSIATGLQSINIAPMFGITDLNASLYSSTGKLLGSGTNILLGTPEPAGSYYEVITGTGNGTSGGIFAGSISVSPVPEASTLAMMLAGLALLGVAAYRKKS
jgi:hypothetical protein